MSDCCPYFPPLPTRICTVIIATAKHAANGFELLPQASVEARAKVCSSCDYYDRPSGKCRVCGCYVGDQVSHFNKCALATEDCPKGKWPAFAGKSPTCSLRQAPSDPSDKRTDREE